MILDKKNAQKFAYEYIRERILNGTYSGGMKLVEERLADEIGVSRTPIREAIKTLEQEGLIKKKQIVNPTAQDLIYLYDIRILLEGFAAKRAAKNMTPEKIKELEKTIKNSRSSFMDGQSKEMYNANQRFHELIINECQNPLIVEKLEEARTIFYLFSLRFDLYSRPNIIEEHEEIYHAIKDKNEQLANELMAKHLQNDMNFTLEFIGRRGQY